jgi:hypothetical protein
MLILRGWLYSLQCFGRFIMALHGSHVSVRANIVLRTGPRCEEVIASEGAEKQCFSFWKANLSSERASTIR